MTDEDVVRRFADVMACGIVRERPDRRPNRQLCFEWWVEGNEAIVVAELLLPHLGHRRTMTAQALIGQMRPDAATCEECDKTFAPKDSRSRFCSDVCREAERLRRDRRAYYREYSRRQRASGSRGTIALVLDGD
jgi:hypothetical protein